MGVIPFETHIYIYIFEDFFSHILKQNLAKLNLALTCFLFMISISPGTGL